MSLVIRMSFVCVLFRSNSKAREICEEIIWGILDNGEFLINKDILKRTQLGYVIKRLEKEGLIVVHKEKSEKTIRVTLSNALKRDILKAYMKLTHCDSLVHVLSEQQES